MKIFPNLLNALRGGKKDPDFSNVQGGSTKAPDFSSVQGGSSSTAATAAARTYTVVSGESLSKIAQREYGHASQWTRIYEANRDLLTDPDKILPGQMLKIPA